MTAIRCTVQKALADYFCLDIQGRPVLSGRAHWRGRSTAIVIYVTGMPWLVVRNTGYEPAGIRPPLLGYLAGGAEEVINPKPAAMAKSRVWPYLRKNGWEAASELLALNEILRSELARNRWEDHLTAKIVAIPQGPPYPVRLRRRSFSKSRGCLQIWWMSRPGSDSRKFSSISIRHCASRWPRIRM